MAGQGTPSSQSIPPMATIRSRRGRPSDRGGRQSGRRKTIRSWMRASWPTLPEHRLRRLEGELHMSRSPTSARCNTGLRATRATSRFVRRERLLTLKLHCNQTTATRGGGCASDSCAMTVEHAGGPGQGTSSSAAATGTISTTEATQVPTTRVNTIEGAYVSLPSCPTGTSSPGSPPPLQRALVTRSSTRAANDMFGVRHTCRCSKGKA